MHVVSLHYSWRTLRLGSPLLLQKTLSKSPLDSGRHYSYCKVIPANTTLGQAWEGVVRFFHFGHQIRMCSEARPMASCCFQQPFISLQSPGSFHWRMVFRNQDLLTRCAHCYWTIVVPRCSQKNILENICVHIHIPSHMYLSMYACMYVCNLPI